MTTADGTGRTKHTGRLSMYRGTGLINRCLLATPFTHGYVKYESNAAHHIRCGTLQNKTVHKKRMFKPYIKQTFSVGTYTCIQEGLYSK